MGSYLSRSANIVIHGQCSPADTLLITSVFDSPVKYATWGCVGDRVNNKRVVSGRETKKKQWLRGDFYRLANVYV